MKKFSTILAVLLVLVMMASTVAFASESIKVTADYTNGKINWTVSDYCDLYTVYVNGHKLVNRGESTGSYKIDLDTKEDITVKVVDLMGHADTYTIAAVKPTEAPTATPAPTEEPTPVPTEEPTPVPTEEPTPVPTEEPTPVPTEEPTVAPTEEPTVAPTEEPTVAPTEEPTKAPVVTDAPVEDDVEDDDVPKTGDNTASYVFASVAMMLAAAYLVSRRFSRA